jgi:hypothetical protein
MDGSSVERKSWSPGENERGWNAAIAGAGTSG